MNWANVANRPLQKGDLIRMVDDSLHLVNYVNSSGAYVTPLNGVIREIKGHEIEFTAGGRTISARSAVELVNPLTLGGNSQEYTRYVKMSRALGDNSMARRRKGASLVDFIDSEDDFTRRQTTHNGIQVFTQQSRVKHDYSGRKYSEAAIVAARSSKRLTSGT